MHKRDYLVIKPMELKSDSIGSVFLPDGLRVPSLLADVIWSGDACQAAGLLPGDVVGWGPFDYEAQVGASDGHFKRVGDEMYSIYMNHLTFKSKDKHMKTLSGYGPDVIEPIGEYLILEMDEIERTKSGLVINRDEDKRWRLDSGTIINAGPFLNAGYKRPEVSIGDRVIIAPNAAGGQLSPINGKKYRRMAARDIMAVISQDGSIRPVGGYLLCRRIRPEESVALGQGFVDATFTASGLILPKTREDSPLDNRVEVLEVGSGMSEQNGYYNKSVVMIDGAFEPGQTWITTQLVSHTGFPADGANALNLCPATEYYGKDQHLTMFLLPSWLVFMYRVTAQ